MSLVTRWLMLLENAKKLGLTEEEVVDIIEDWAGTPAGFDTIWSLCIKKAASKHPPSYGLFQIHHG